MIIRKIPPKESMAKKRVAAYCRVSTLREEQNESIETQKRYYHEMIQHSPKWELVRIYADRNSATSAKQRLGFQHMIADAQEKKLDIVLCKSISRFARNIVDCQKYIRWFTAQGISIIFEEQNICTDDPTSSLILSMMSAIAQDESHSISRNVRAGYESRFARGEYNLGSNRILGYDCVNGVLVPNGEAWMVREIFDRFVAGESYRAISNAVVAKGARSKRGLDHFAPATLRYMLSNETYVGDKMLQKQPPKNYLTGKPDPNCEYHSNYLTDDHEAIVDRATWNRAQERLNRCAQVI